MCGDEDLTTADINWKTHGCQVVGGFYDGRPRLLEAEGGLLSESLCRVFNAFEVDDEVVCIALYWETMTVLSSSETRLILFNLRAGEEVRGFVGHRSSVTCLRVDSVSRRFLSASYDGSVMLWDIASGTCLKTYHMDRGCCDFVSCFCVCWHTLHAVFGYESGRVELRSFDSDSSVTVLRKELRGSSISCIAVDWAREKFVISFNRIKKHANRESKSCCFSVEHYALSVRLHAAWACAWGWNFQDGSRHIGGGPRSKK